jgi:hypothetical protein
MEVNAAGQSLIAKLVPIIIVIGGLVGLYYLYQYLFGPKTSNSTELISATQKADIDASKPITITTQNLPAIYEGGEFTISSWLYINNWSYRSGFNKQIISIGGPNFDTIRIYLGGVKPTIHVRLQTHDKSSLNMPQVDNLEKSTLNSTFNILQTGSGLLDGTPICDLPEVELQRWVHLSVAVNGRTVDVYLDGKLARSCVLPDFYRVDSGGYTATLLAYGGFGGQISTTTIYDSALNPEAVYRNYMAGPEPITNILSWLQSFFTPSVTL